MTDLLDRFRAHLESADRSPRTVDIRLRDLSAFVAWFEQTTGREFEPVAVTPPDVRDYRAYLQTVKGLKPNTVNRALSSLSVFFTWAQGEGLVATNPCRAVRPVPQQPRPPRRLDRNVALNDRSGHIVVRSGKRGKYREVPLNAGARKALREWLEVRPDVDSDALFIGRDRIPLKPRGVQRRLDFYARRAGLEGVTPHVLRHTFGKNLVDAGRPLTEVAALLGHARLNTTGVYTQPGQEDPRRAVEAVDWEES